LKLKDSGYRRAGVETEFLYPCPDSEEFCFNGGPLPPGGRIHRVSKKEFQEKELISDVGRASGFGCWRYY
jgi:hypothetical protein